MPHSYEAVALKEYAQANTLAVFTVSGASFSHEPSTFAELV